MNDTERLDFLERYKLDVERFGGEWVVSGDEDDTSLSMIDVARPTLRDAIDGAIGEISEMEQRLAPGAVRQS